ncbi:class I SAM-dependent methyltransferase [Alienimonas californiensis]|uniref:16S ribosomal RNA methyltransferase KsgA/Dim1 family protein n=1 Tax=Alienimonas californiensis TaxID=2527989 RepID=A0A517P6W8_9PLAN|nr:methyltransferase domain-containing protein [Alienimonas californiensis]QDT15120.1 16S ribosomal RNA methyltransferase KsgA/Dim1 family protein [Alienimonas californiensis]
MSDAPAPSRSAPPQSQGTAKPKGSAPAAVQFLARFARSPRTVGAVLPSSRFLAEAMLDSVNWDAAECVLEFGPGTGPFTRFVPDRLKPDARFLAVERDPAFVARLQRELPHVDVAHADVTDAAGELKRRDLGPADAILCGLPWAAFPPELQNRLMTATLDCLKPGGSFATFAYVQGALLPAGRRFRALLDERFSHVGASPVVWRNAPPAFVYRCVK